jgi:glycosyltransferase involved in cell wall biosynthesis
VIGERLPRTWLHAPHDALRSQFKNRGLSGVPKDSLRRRERTIDKMNITVILCTYNRCESLAKALESSAALRLPESVEWEILVVDNNSIDKTRKVVEGYCCRYPGRFRYLFEPQQGKSYALNAGIREARGNVLVFTDDDVTVEPTWLQNLTASLDTGEWVGAGGRTAPERTFSPPRWLGLDTPYALGPLALFDLGAETRQLTEPPFGNNMAYRREVFKKYGDFRTELGPCPGSEIRSEDTEFGKRLLSAGERLRYEPSAIVYHAVPADRIQKSYFLDWWFDKARAEIRESGIPSDTRWFVAGIPMYLFHRLAVWILRWMCGAGPARRFFGQRQAWWVAGTILECFRQSRVPR